MPIPVLVKRYTLEEFDAFVNRPENAELRFEYIGGEIVEVPSNPYSSQVAALFITYIGMYLLKKPIGRLTGEQGGYRVLGEKYAPDVAFISRAKQTALSYGDGYNPSPPDLVIEIVSPSDRELKLSVKIANYLAAGTTVWVAYARTREVYVYQPGKAVVIVPYDGILDGDTILPGFQLAVKDIFPPIGNEE